jgi:hypothetical protein
MLINHFASCYFESANNTFRSQESFVKSVLLPSESEHCRNAGRFTASRLFDIFATRQGGEGADLLDFDGYTAIVSSYSANSPLEEKMFGKPEDLVIFSRKFSLLLTLKVFFWTVLCHSLHFSMVVVFFNPQNSASLSVVMSLDTFLF